MKPSQNFNLIKILRTCGGLSGLVVIILGIVQLLTVSLVPKLLINGCYQIIFGLLAIMAELRWEQVLTHFKFLTHFLGLGLFYIFIGGLALGSEWYNIAVAIVLLAVGILYTSLGICCRRFGQETFDGNNNEAPKGGQGQGGENQPINSAPPSDSSSYIPPALNNRPVSSSNSDILPTNARSPWGADNQSNNSIEKRGSYSSVPINDNTNEPGGERGNNNNNNNNKGAWGGGGDGWSAAHSEGDVNIPRAITAAAIANPQQTIAIASAVASNPIARGAAQGAWDSAVSGNNREDQRKKSSMEYAIRQSNPFAEQ